MPDFSDNHSPDTRAANLEDIARKAGVSRSTVSRVINNEPYVSQTTRDKVLAVVRAEGFVPNPAARMLVTQRTRVIGVVIPHTLQIAFQDPYYFPTLLQGVSETTYARDYATLLWWGQSRDDEDRFYERILQQNRLMDGLIIASATSDDPLIPRLVELGTPFVMVERPARLAERIHYVTIDNIQAAQNAVQHLADLGRRRIGTITGSLYNIDAQDRLTGYRNALERMNLPYDPALVAEGRFTHPSGSVAAKRLVKQGVDAIFAANDMMAVGALQAMQELGVRVPEDVSLVGFDDLPQAVQVTPQLTTVRQPVQHKGTAATNLLIDLIEGQIQGPQQILLPTQLVIRQSCGAIRL
jgi:DNA-binding LacI/PurR family transcriptional regulator